MTKITRFTACLMILAAFAVMSFFGPERAAAVPTTNSASSSATTHIVIPLEIVRVDELSFGTFASPTSAPGSISVDPDLFSPSPVSTTGVNFVGGGAAGVGSFSVVGEPNTAYKMDAGSSTTATLNCVSSSCTGSTMSVNLVFYSLTKSAVAFPTALGNGGMLNPVGQDILYYGGTLNINQHQDDGTYQGTFPVILNY